MSAGIILAVSLNFNLSTALDTFFVAAVLIGLLMFGTLPDWLSWTGIVLIVGSG